MKKYLLLLVLLFGALYGHSQEMKNIILFAQLKQFDKAKAEVDGYLGIEKNASLADGWFYKAYIYNALGRSETKTVTESRGIYQAAFDALKKYAELDPKGKQTKEEKNSTVFNIYYGFNDLGIKSYNNKEFDQSFECFKKTLELHDYIINNDIEGPNGLRLAKHDSDLVWNLVVLTNELKKKEEGIIFKKLIADADLSEDRYVSVYDDLILYYKKKNDPELFTKYITAAQKHYPGDKQYWENLEIEFALSDLEGLALLTKYDELSKKFPENYLVTYNYALEVDKYMFDPEFKSSNTAAYRIKLEELLTKAVSIKSTIPANLLLANMYYSRTFDLKEQIAKIKGTNPNEVKLRNELIAKVKSTSATCIPYAEEAVKLLKELTEYKFADKANYKLALEILSNAYKNTGDNTKLAENEKLRAEVEKL